MVSIGQLIICVTYPDLNNLILGVYISHEDSLKCFFQFKFLNYSILVDFTNNGICHCNENET